MHYLVHKNEMQGVLDERQKLNVEEFIRAMTEAEHDKFHQEATSFLMKFGFLMIGYEPDYTWWELVVTLRKVCMALLSTLLANDIYLQGSMAELIVILVIWDTVLMCS